MDKICLHCFVSGRVQGVFYRAFVQEQAKILGITGFAKNLSDGRVEVLLSGERKVVEELRDKLWEGPSRANVEKVEVEEVSIEKENFNKYTDFRTL